MQKKRRFLWMFGLAFFEGRGSEFEKRNQTIVKSRNLFGLCVARPQSLLVLVIFRLKKKSIELNQSINYNIN